MAHVLVQKFVNVKMVIRERIVKMLFVLPIATLVQHQLVAQVASPVIQVQLVSKNCAMENQKPIQPCAQTRELVQQLIPAHAMWGILEMNAKIPFAFPLHRPVLPYAVDMALVQALPPVNALLVIPNKIVPIPFASNLQVPIPMFAVTMALVQVLVFVNALPVTYLPIARKSLALACPKLNLWFAVAKEIAVP